MLQNIHKLIEKCTKSFIFESRTPGKLLACCIIWNPRNTNYYDCQMFWIIFYHHSEQNEVISVVSEMLESALAPLRWEISDPLHTNSMHRLCTQPYHNPVKKSWFSLSWLVGQLEFENSCLFFLLFQRKQPCTDNSANHLLITVCTF